MGSGHVHEAPLAGSAVGRLDARAKLMAVVPAIVLVNAVGMERWPVIAAVAGAFVVLLVLCGRGAAIVLRRGLYLLPFVLFVLVTLPFSAAGETWFDLDLGVGVLTATHEGAARAVDAGLRSGTSIVGLLVLSGTTEATDLFAGLAALKLPRAFVLVLSMVYRYLFLLGSDLARLRRAARARGFSMRSRRSLPRLGTMAGTLLGRSVVRSDRVHKAMLARGFAGEVRTLPRGHFGRAEAVFLVLFYASLALGVVAAFHA